MCSLWSVSLSRTDPIRDSTFQLWHVSRTVSPCRVYLLGSMAWVVRCRSMHSYSYVYIPREAPQTLTALKTEGEKACVFVFMIIMLHPSSGGCSIYAHTHPVFDRDGEDESMRACCEYRSRKRSIVAWPHNDATLGRALLCVAHSVTLPSLLVCLLHHAWQNIVKLKIIQIKVRCIRRRP